MVEDLRALPTERPIIAEGPGFFPVVILPLVCDPRQAIWLVPTEAFKRTAHARRDKTAFRFKTSDPERAHRNHVERDLLLAEVYRRAARELGLPIIEVDGSMPPEEVASAVAAHFGSVLAATMH